MALEDYIINIDTSYTDDNDLSLIGNNDVLSVFYYDATTSGSIENWKKDWGAVNPVNNNTFSLSEPGTSWTLVTDDSEEPYTCQISRFANWNNTDLLRGMSVTSSGYTNPNTDVNVVDYFTNYGWETDDGVGPGEAALRVDMGSVKDVNYIWFMPGWETDVTKAIKDYHVGVSDTGGENDFTTVVSGTTVSGSYAPVIDFLGNIQTRYIKIYIDSNWGHATKSRLFRISAFYEPNWSMYGYKNDGFTDGTDSYWQQIVNLANIDTLFFDARAYMTNAYQVGNLAVMASGIGGVTNDVLKEYDWASTGTSWLDSTDENHWTRREEQVDVSSYSGNTAFKLRIYNESYYRKSFFGYFDNIETQPLWYREGKSSYRGVGTAFPDEVYVISDRSGVSIIDKTDVSLWMRFQIGAGNVLESTARDVVAKDGYIYLATTRGLVIIDFINNRAWKIDNTGVHYRMSLGSRNEYGMWFIETALDTIPSNDVYSVDIGEHSGDFFVIVGHGYGMSYIKTPVVVGTRVVNDSDFTYPVRKVKTYLDDTGDVERIVYVGGYDNRARLGVMENITIVKAGGFGDQTMFLHSDGMSSDAMLDGISSQWVVRDGNLPLSYEAGYVAISGVKSNFGSTTMLQKDLVPDQPFVASLDVKIDRWPERGSGGLHFGVTSGWPASPILYEVTSQALSLSALNTVDGAIIEDEKFLTFPDKDNWMLTLKSHDNTQVLSENSAFKLHAYLTGSPSPGVAYGSILGHLRTFTAKTFTAKVKARCTRFDLSTHDSYLDSVIFGISDGSYLGEGSGAHLLCMGLYSHNTDASPPVYSLAYTSTLNSLTWDTDTLATFTGDMTESAEWHQWEFTYNADTETINASIDGLLIGEYTFTSMGGEIGIVLGVAGVISGGYATVYFKDFEIDFGENFPHAKKEYAIQTYNDGVYTIPTISGTHLNGLPFSVLDGTYASNWRAWTIEYDGTTLAGFIDGMEASTPAMLGLGNNNQRLFVHYDLPAVVSGTVDERDADIKIKNFTIEYTSSEKVISGSPNNFWLESGSYLGVDYNSLFIATLSGVERLSYVSSATVSGTPATSATYGINGSGFGSEVLYGTIRNTSSIEVESGSVGDNGLLYTGSSRYSFRGWERLIDRYGNLDTGNEISITVSPDGARIFEFYYDGSTPYLYYIDTGVLSSAWHPFTQSDYPAGFGDINNSRGYMFDMQDGDLYCIAPSWFGIYSIGDTKWHSPDVNLANGAVLPGGGIFSNWEAVPIYTRKQLFLMYKGQTSLMFLSSRYWTSQYRHSPTNWWAVDAACVYSDVDDSIYALTYGTSDNFQRMPMDTIVFSESLGDCPFPYDFDYGISAFYRPYDESIYYVMQGATQAYGRKLLRYDVKAQTWSTWGEDFPSTVYKYMTAAYAFEEDVLYVIAGTESASMYKYYFPRDIAPRFVSWSSSDSLLPEASIVARFRKIAFDTEAGNPSDSFTDSKVSPQWFQNIYGTNGAITEGTSHISIVCDNVTQSANTNIIRSIPVPAYDFTATAQVKINNMARSTGAIASSRNMFMFGVTDFIGTPGSRANLNDVEMGLSMVGMSGLFMTATNDESDDVNKYSLYKAELTADTYYNTSLYKNFGATDATTSAEFKEWRIEYDHSAKQLDAYIDGVSVGSTTFTGNGFEQGASLYLGCQRYLNSVSGTLDVDINSLSVVADSTASMVSNYLRLDDNDEYGYLHYEKFDATIVSGTGYAYQSDIRVETYSLTDNAYVSALGSMEDGQKQATLAAVYGAGREIGLYLGGDPRAIGSYTAVAHDWSARSVYKMVSDTSTLKVYVDDASIPSISIPYDSLPNSEYRRCRFGSFNLDNKNLVWSSNTNGHVITVSGSWSHNEQESSYYGHNYTINTDSVDDKIVSNFNETDSGYLYMFYSVAANRSQASPVTVYHEGVLDLPVADAYASNPFASVTDNRDEYGNVDANATQLVINQERFMDGSNYDRLFRDISEMPSGWVYLGRYTNISHVVVTTDGSGTGINNNVDVDSFLIRHTDTQPRARSVCRVYSVGYTLGGSSVAQESDYEGGFSIIDMNAKVQVDAYSNQTSPSIIDDNIYDFDVVQ